MPEKKQLTKDEMEKLLKEMEEKIAEGKRVMQELKERIERKRRAKLN
jgi:hypothetical protein